MSIPISIIFQISPPFWPKLVYLFFSSGNGYENDSSKQQIFLPASTTTYYQIEGEQHIFLLQVIMRIFYFA